MPRHFLSLLAGVLVCILAASSLVLDAPAGVRADVGGVSSNAPTFGKGQTLTITVSAEDDDGDLTIISNLPGSSLRVEGCDDIGVQVAGECDGDGLDAVDGNATEYVTIDTDGLDTDEKVELMSVTLTLRASCSEPTIVTIAANQPGNVGPDDVTVNCIPPTPTPTPTPTRTPTPTPTPTYTPVPTSTPNPSVTPIVEVSSGTPPVITPPSTGDAGIR
jgi:hypothetical protein